MTEAEWLTCNDPRSMLAFVREKMTDRQLALFKAACCRRACGLLTNPCFQDVISALERYAEGLATRQEIEAAGHIAVSAFSEMIQTRADDSQAVLSAANAVCLAASFEHPLYRLDGHDYALAASEAVAIAAGHAAPVVSKYSRNFVAEREVQAALLRDIASNLFHLVRAEPDWLSCNGHTVRRLAQAIYEEDAFDRLPILADALEEAGCGAEHVLAHCRGLRRCGRCDGSGSRGAGSRPRRCGKCSGTGWRKSVAIHVRGCWALDLILGRE